MKQYLYDIVNNYTVQGKYAQGEISNKLYLIHVDEMILHNAGSSAGFNIALKREGEKKNKKEKKKLSQHRVFAEQGRTGLNFVERARHGTDSTWNTLFYF